MNNTQNQYHVIGLMSGTSLDGLDIAYCRFLKQNNQWSFELLQTTSIEYPLMYQKQLTNAIHLDSVDLLQLHNTYGTWLGNQITTFIEDHTITTLDFVSSHGHTVFHQPEKGMTLQIGSGQHIANACEQKVVCDFRTNDVALGGQGAPLVPIGDQWLFATYDFCLNLGGISNISFHHNNQRIAYDICPVNMLLNFLCSKIGKTYDDRGTIARTGVLNLNVLDQLNGRSYYAQPFPKSLGYEWFADQILPIIDTSQDTVENLLHTAVQHITTQIANAIKKTGKTSTKLLVTGGGAKNDFLIEVLQQKLEGVARVVIPSEHLIDFKEALIFAFMGVLRDRHEINCLQSVTGAQKDTSSGVIYWPH